MFCDFYMLFLAVREWVTEALVSSQMLLQAYSYAAKSWFVYSGEPAFFLYIFDHVLISEITSSPFLKILPSFSDFQEF